MVADLTRGFAATARAARGGGTMAITGHSQLQDAQACARVVVKIGSALLVGADGAPDAGFMAAIAGDIAGLRARGQAVVVVTSGAIALGAARLGLAQAKRNLADAQAAAAVGQIRLASAWADALEREGLVAAQMLLSLDDFEDRARYLNASATLERLLEGGAVPVVNENDSVATEEIRFGDNDRLAARVGQAARAQAVVLLSDVDGLYTAAPGTAGAERIERVEGVTPDILAMADASSGSGLGTGGMLSKLRAAEIAERAGIALVIAKGAGDHPLADALVPGGGTLFVPQADADARRSWLGGRQRAAGRLVVDAGCVGALRSGKSLLAAGITGVEGEFARGDLLEVSGPDGVAVAQGLSEYAADACRAIMGRRSDALEAILGHAPRSAVIHRDHMVLL